MKIAIIGSRGIPANYGGFETLVEKLVENLYSHIEITVYCSSKYYDKKLDSYKGAKLRYLNIGANNFSGIIYDTVSLFQTLPKFDKVIMLGAQAGFILPLFGKLTNKIIFHYGGLDFNRNKWNKITQKFIKWGKDIATKYSKIIIADNVGIQEFLNHEYKRESRLISYGADHVLNPDINGNDYKNFPFLNEKYALTVARIQKDNNIETIINSFQNNQKYSLVVIGNWNNSKWGIQMKNKYKNFNKIYLLDPIYHQYTLDKIRKSCHLYIHGHSAGGTNPSLVEAMYMGLPIIAYNSIFNKFTTKGDCLYFNNQKDLEKILRNITAEKIKTISKDMAYIAKENYTWSKISNSYLKLFLS